MELVGEADSILRTPSVDWTFDDSDRGIELAQKLAGVMDKHHGMGLAANQVGLNVRVFVMGESHNNHWACFNPVIVEAIGEPQKSVEGCLSFPHLLLDIPRHPIILVRYSDFDGDVVEEEFAGKWARCFQHELDHINGICFDQKVSKLSLAIAKRKRDKLIKRMSNVE